MATLIGQSRKSIVDLSDRKNTYFYLSSLSQKTQIYDKGTNKYILDWKVKNFVISAILQIDGIPYMPSMGTLTITWKKIINGIEEALGTNEELNSSSDVLTIKDNILTETAPYISYRADYTFIDKNTNIKYTGIDVFDLTLVTNGLNGEGVVFSLYTPDGDTFINGEGSKKVQSNAYSASNPITGEIYKWYKYSSGIWELIPTADTDSYIVLGNDVEGHVSIKCVMTYKGNDYTDIVTLVDKTDSFTSAIDSTAGNIFKNTIGRTCLACRVWQNGKEVDSVKCKYDKFLENAPMNPKNGDFYHKINANGVNPSTQLFRYNGTIWEDVTSNSMYRYKYIYKWYRRNQDGEIIDTEPYANGKVIYVDDKSVVNKTVFVCEVSER